MIFLLFKWHLKVFLDFKQKAWYIHMILRISDFYNLVFSNESFSLSFNQSYTFMFPKVLGKDQITILAPNILYFKNTWAQIHLECMVLVCRQKSSFTLLFTSTPSNYPLRSQHWLKKSEFSPPTYEIIRHARI